ncbi:glycosyltransferase WecB/TagA/CpsF family [Komagataeibacter medellinensis NBRC 3288]|uniref:Glycosyltransferase WecB/TagA/CpsF family n=2 Tax=Komagataeibacter medellinensis TaxID=1177712 RepID=G2I3M7_KOMMN|nr:glycosyltransferase WecB/TagA/CpsF family [Komagataeibacter medellinensis NBRC 3288]
MMNGVFKMNANTEIKVDNTVVDVMGLPLSDISRDEIIERVISAVRARQKMVIVNANAHMAVVSQGQGWLRTLFRRADIAFCDGAGVQLAAMVLTGRRLPRTTPPEWIGPVLSRLGGDASVFWIGGKPGVVEDAARAFSARYGVRTAGTQHGFFDQTPGSRESIQLLERVLETRPDIILLTMGMPRQESWLRDNMDHIPTGVMLTAGALVDHAAGHVHRPPRWVANMGLEWLVRLVREPRRLWRRYLLGLPVFGFYVLVYLLRKGRGGAASSLSRKLAG